MRRQHILEQLGWAFVRIRGSEFFRNADRAMGPAFDKRAEFNILPGPSDVQENDRGNTGF